MKYPSRLAVALAFCCAFANGCVLSQHHEGGSNAWFTLSKNSDDAFLLVLRNFTYEFASPIPGSLRKGVLDDATSKTLQDLLAPENIRRYVDIQREVGWDDSCWQEGVHIEFRRQGAACWIPAEVKDQPTSRMLEYLLQLYERIRACAPSADGGC